MPFYKNYFSFEQIMSKKMTWNDVTIKKYLEFKDIVDDVNLIEEDKMIEIANILFDEDITELPLVEFNKKIKELEFIKTEPPKEKFAKSYTINGVKYKTKGSAENIQANQFIDFQNYAKKKDIIGCISCFFVPDGHKYNDGYDMIKVKEDIGDLPITTANALAFFFQT